MSTGGDGRIRVLVVDDSPVSLELLVHILDHDLRLRVVGTACDGVAAVEQAKRLLPDVVTMDIHMPKMDGLEATRRIMEQVPTPIVVVSSSGVRTEVAAGFRIIEAGALAVVDKPRGASGDDVAKLLETVRLMAQVKVVRRWPRIRAGDADALPAAEASQVTKPVRVVAIGASTGGPPVLRNILAGLPQDFPVPLVIIQHITPGFSEGLAQWLGRSSGFAVALASDGEVLCPGRALIAPDAAHLTVVGSGAIGARVVLNGEPPENGHRPSVSRLFRSVAQSCGGAAIGVLLSGMGRDGAEELVCLRRLGALTIVQHPDSAVVPGMPGAAIALGAATQVLAPQHIAAALMRAVGTEHATDVGLDQSR